MAENFFAGVNLTQEVSAAIGPVLNDVAVVIDGQEIACKGRVTLNPDNTATIRLIHNTGALRGDLRPLEGSVITWLRKDYYIEDVGGTPFVSWVCECGPPRDSEGRVTPEILIAAFTNAIQIVARRFSTGSVLRYRFRRNPVNVWFTGEAGSAVINIPRLDLAAEYYVEAWIVDSEGIRSPSVTATVTTRS